MIKLKQIQTVMDELTLIFEVDFPDGSIKTISIAFSEIKEVLRQVQSLLGRTPTLNDFKDAVKAYVNKIREQQTEVKQSFSIQDLIGVDLEGS